MGLHGDGRTAGQQLSYRSQLRETCFWRYPLNGLIDEDEIWAQLVSACYLFFCNILLERKITISESCHWLVMLSMAPTLFTQCSSRAKFTAASRDLGFDL